MLRYVTKVTFLFVYFRIWKIANTIMESQAAQFSAR